MTDDFETFFKQATRCTPFPYQCRLADPTSDLPELLQVPTGTGKTAASVLSWRWRRKQRPAETPRKVVDQATTVVERIRERLLAPEGSRWSSHEGSLNSLGQGVQRLPSGRPDSLLLAVSRLRGEPACGDGDRRQSRAPRTCACI